MSKKHPGRRRVASRTDSSPDDVFIDRTLAAGKWAQRHQRLIVIGAFGLAILVAGLTYYRSYQGSLTTQANQELELVHRMIVTNDQVGAKEALVQFVQNFDGTLHGPEARLLLGDLYLRDDEAEQARVVLEPVGASPSSPIEFQAATLLAQAYEEDGDIEGAEEVYLRIADRADLSFQVRNALEAAARLRATRGNLAGAAELYEQIIKDAEDNDPDMAVFEMRLSEVRTAMES